MAQSAFFHDLDSLVLRLILSFVSSHAPSALQHHLLLLSAVHGTVVQYNATCALAEVVAGLRRSLRGMVYMPPDLTPQFRCAAYFYDMAMVVNSPDFLCVKEIQIPTIEVLSWALDAVDRNQAPDSCMPHQDLQASMFASEILEQLLTKASKARVEDSLTAQYSTLVAATRDSSLARIIVELLRATVLWRLRVMVTADASSQLFEARDLLGTIRVLQCSSR